MLKHINNNLAKLRSKFLRNIERDLEEADRNLKSLSDAVDNISTVTKDNADKLSNLEHLVVLQNQALQYAAAPVIPVSDSEVATKIFNSLIMYLDPRDIAVAPHIILERVWEKEVTIAWLRVLESSPGIVFDVGANFGYYGMLAANKLAKESSKVVLFEPNPNLIPYIDKNLAVNWLKENTVVECMGVSDSKGVAQLSVLEDYIGSSSMNSIELLKSYADKKMKVKANSVMDVPTITIDEYCAKNGIKHIDLMKIDIEGYEQKAYYGMEKIIKSSPGMILFIEFTKYAYEEPEHFYGQILKDFPNVYNLSPEGVFLKPKSTSYKDIIEPVNDLVFLVFSKQKLATN